MHREDVTEQLVREKAREETRARHLQVEKAITGVGAEVGSMPVQVPRVTGAATRRSLESLADYHERRSVCIRALLRALPGELPSLAEEGLEHLVVSRIEREASR